MSCTPRKELQPDLLTQLGDAATTHDTQQAESLYLRALKAEPQNHATRYKLLQLYLHHKNYAAILKQTQHLSLTPATLDLLRIRAIAFDLRAEHEKAQDIYNQILEKFPNDRKTQMNLILSCRLSGDSFLEEVTEKSDKDQT